MFSNYIISAKRDPTRVFFLDFNLILFFLYLRGLKCSLHIALRIGDSAVMELKGSEHLAIHLNM